MLLSCSDSYVPPTDNRKTIIIGIDGAGNNFSQDTTPYIFELCRNDIFNTNSKAVLPTTSAQNWGAILTGLSPEITCFTNESIKTSENLQFPTVFKKLREKYKWEPMASIVNWSPINTGIIENKIDITKINCPDDQAVTEQVIQYINENDFKLVFVQFDSIDYAGHLFGYGTEKYFEMLKDVDSKISQIVNTLIKKGYYRDTLIIICTDHGGTGVDHGGQTSQEVNTFFGAKKPYNFEIELNKPMSNLEVSDIVLDWMLNRSK